MSQKVYDFVTGDNLSQDKMGMRNVQPVNRRENFLPCLACNKDEANSAPSLHSTGLCKEWGKLSHRQRIALVKCVKHPFSQDEHTTLECTRNINRPCSYCGKEDDHSSLLCPEFQSKKKESRR